MKDGRYTLAEMSDPLQIVFCGTSAFAVPSLRALKADPTFHIVAVITQPDRPVGREQILRPSAVKTAALELGLPILQPESLNAFAQAQSLPVHDFLVVVSYGQILDESILRLPQLDPINVHASLLPRWRGASPIQSAILAGDRETGVTVQRMVRELDAGPILAQVKTPIGDRETGVMLHNRLAEMGGRLLVETLKGPRHTSVQDEAQVTHCRKLTREDGVVDIDTMTAEEIDRCTRALNPWPGVRVIGQDNAMLKILKTSLTPEPEALAIQCMGNTTLYLALVQEPGGKPMSGQAWERGKKSRM
jgi:methionyl-tRNA formyltransferase